jgi:hypothetical protein
MTGLEPPHAVVISALPQQGSKSCVCNERKARLTFVSGLTPTRLAIT